MTCLPCRHPTKRIVLAFVSPKFVRSAAINRTSSLMPCAVAVTCVWRHAPRGYKSGSVQLPDGGWRPKTLTKKVQIESKAQMRRPTLPIDVLVVASFYLSVFLSSLSLPSIYRSSCLSTYFFYLSICISIFCFIRISAYYTRHACMHACMHSCMRTHIHACVDA